MRIAWLLATLALALAALSLPQGAMAQQRLALLVGVSNYPKQPDGRDISLRGPANDVRLMQRVLAERGFQPGNVTVLADGVQGAGDPTRAAIVGALDALAKKAGKGDFVFLLFAGHGSQQPARNIGPANPEPDGLDETFLPRDIGRWDGANTVQNAIVDDEFDGFITAIRNRGAFVWAVFDSCHSGTVTRSVVDDPEVRTREIRPADLGIPKEAIARAQAEAAAKVPRSRSVMAEETGALGKAMNVAPGAGGFVAFYAVQSHELEKEERLPAGHPDRQSHGRLTFNLTKVLAMSRGMSYRQAGQQILQQYAAANFLDTTPLVEGPSLDAPVFGDKEGPRILQWPLVRDGTTLRVEAGAVHQIGEGAVFAVLPDAVSGEDKALGYLSASKVEIYRSTLVPAEHQGKPKLDPAKIPERAYLRLVSANHAIGIRVALPAAPAGKAKAVLDKLAKAETPGMRVTWTQPKEGGDVRLFVRDDKLWLLQPAGELVPDGANKTHSIDLAANSEQQLHDKLVEMLRAMGKAMGLMRLAGQTQASTVGRAVETTVQVLRSGKPTKADPNKVTTLRAGDEVEVQVKNGHTRAVNVAVFAIHGDYEIVQLYPRGGANAPIEPGKNPFTLAKFRVSAKTVGQESLFFVVTETRAGGEPPDFSFLAQKGVDRTRGAGGDDLMAAFRSIGVEPERSRSAAVASATTERTSMRLLRFVTQPAEAAKK